ncbi:PRTRC system protein A [Burkholderia multivorans]|uniref:PRTRC system protein A n=1 Tax=Burkholderia multivorans TaxID=87883 RepID=UPI000D019659|nr:PRTRC system protein A [Burkholderia multivorans]PRH49742.1 PRTRC system protein A [Burkholderia multivorans]
MSKIESIRATFEAATADTLRALGEALTQFSAQVTEEVKASQARPIAAKAEDASISLDEALFDSAPVATVPRHAEFAPLLDVGHRFLLAAEGLFIEIRRPWLHLIQPLAQVDGAYSRPPYGSLDAKIEFAFGRISAAEQHLRRFAADAAQVAPNEHAAWIIWNETRRELVYREVEVTNSTPTKITINRPALADDESLVFDLHSHGTGPAGFSQTDDADDAGEVKIAGVIGGVGTAAPSVAFRLCALGKTITLRVPVQAFFPSTENAA